MSDSDKVRDFQLFPFNLKYYTIFFPQLQFKKHINQFSTFNPSDNLTTSIITYKKPFLCPFQISQSPTLISDGTEDGENRKRSAIAFNKY